MQGNLIAKDTTHRRVPQELRDIVAIQRGLENSSIFAIHNITDNKLNFSIDDSLNSSLGDVFTYCDYLSGKKYKNLNFVLEPFEVLWIGKIND